MVKSKKYIWEIGASLPTIEDHSIVKLNIIEKYLEAYIKHLTIYPYSTTLKFAIIDGFSGGGLYSFKGEEILGSPLRILETIQRLKKEITFQRENDNLGLIRFDIPVYCIERDKRVYEFLTQTINQRGFKNSVSIINGEFEKKYQAIIKELQDKKYKRALFVLDQYGYADATINTIKNILSSFNNAEIILTFACDSLIDYLSSENKKVYLNLGLDKLQIEHLLDTKQDNDKNRQTLQFDLLKSIIGKIGTCYYTPFFVKGMQTHRAYWLLHFSNHPIARNEMVKLHYQNHNSFIHYAGEGLDMFGYSSKDKNTLKPFLFTQEDKEKSLKLIAEQIEKKVLQYDSKVFGELIRNEINCTPATIEIIQESLKEYLRCNDIEIIDTKRGKKIKNYKNIKLESVIKIPKIRQKRFNF